MSVHMKCSPEFMTVKSAVSMNSNTPFMFLMPANTMNWPEKAISQSGEVVLRIENKSRYSDH